MKKILSFLALLMVAFALPNKASAWNFDENTDPSQVILYFSKPDGNIGDKTMSYDSTNKCWYYEFTPADTYINYYLKVWNSDKSYNTEYNKNSGPTSNGTWATVNLEKVDGETYYLSGLQKGVKCRLEIKGATKSGNTERIQVRYVQTPAVITYEIWGNLPDASSAWKSTSMTNVSGSKWVAENVVVTTTSNFGIRQLTNGSQSAWISASGTSSITASGTFNCKNEGTNFSIAPGTWTLTFDSSTNKLTAELASTAPETLYLVNDGNAGTQTATNDGSNVFTYSVYFHAGDQMYLSTSSAGTAGTNYGPSSNTELVDGTAYSYSKADSKYWVAPVDGEYNITVDWDNSTFTATWVEDVPETLYLIADGEMKTSAIPTDGQFTFSNVELEPGTKLTLSTVDNALTGIYTPGSAVTLNDSEWMSFSYSDNGYWVAPVKGTYDITVDWNSKSLLATWVEVMPTDMYLLVGGTSVASSNSEYGDFNFEVELTKGAQLVLSTDVNGASGTKFTPGAATALEYNEGSTFTNSDSGYWTAPVDGTYTINVNYADKTLTATWVADCPTLYLYNLTGDNWWTKLAIANSKTGTYTFVAKIEQGESLILSTTSSSGSNYANLSPKYTPGADKTISSGTEYSFSSTNTGAWFAPVTGEYTITVTFDERTKTGTLTATWTEPIKKVHMPLSESDFENGKKHYFLVGNRMGEWRLLPEWELKADANGDMVLNNRWIYPGGFAIAVVDKYDNYIKHKYTYYSKQWAFKDDVLECTEDFSGTGASMTATGTMSSPSNNFWTEFSSSVGGGDYWQATGTLVTEIRVGLKNGLPSTLKFTVGDKADANKYRFFTLVGDGIYNNNFCNSYGPGTTLQKSKGQTTNNGWQEGWIQYDPVTHEPYVDGNYNYLYHTSYTPDYFKANPSLFNQTLSDGSTFSYTSNEAQFVEYTHLNNLDSDPYKEFYQSFAGTTETISTGVEKSGNGYDFKVETVNGSVTPASGNNWSCYVVRDMWINGEIKIWTGWGGNDRKSGGSDVNGSTWHGENGGPATAGLQVQGYDITAGTNVKLYNNEKNVDGVNYKISDGEPVYFNRVILWYNINEGIGDSFVQFIQESAGPAIFAQLATNPETSANNYIKYNWYLNAAQNDTDSDRQVVGYQIQRYTYVDGVKTFIGYPEGDYVDISGYNVTVEKLQQATAGNYSFTSFTDAGIDGLSGFAPGMYQYDIVVTFADGAQKNAVSNKVAIYDDNIITPSAYALQLVRLNEDGKTKLGVTQEYLTYNPSVEGNWFVLDVEKIVDGEETYGKPYNAELRKGSEMLEFMMNNQDKYDFTSNFYIRALDKKIYDSTFEEYIREGLVTDESIPTPNVTAFDGYEVTSQAYPFTLGDNEFYSAVLFREGNLEKRTAEVTVEYTYLDANGEEVTESPENHTELQPVTPLPYNPSYSYEVVAYDVETESDYIEVEAPTRGSASFGVPKSTSWAKVATSEGKLTTNMMVLNVTYNRPNVDEEILSVYQIEESVAIKDGDESYSESFWFYYAEDKAAAVEHIFSAEGVSPYNSSVPAVDFHQTRYLPIYIEVDGVDTNRFSDGPNGSFGQGIKFSAPHAIESKAGDGLSGVHLGKIEREDGTWDWMYKGHESFVDKAPVLVETGATYENQATQTIAPNYYLYELSNGTDDLAYDFLVAHPACDHRTGDVTVDETTGFVLNDEDPLIGTYVVKGFAKETIPAVHVSSIYLFSNPKLCLIDGEIPTSLQGSLNTLAAELPTEDEMAKGNVGGMPDYGTAVNSADILEGWALLGQTYSNTPSEGNVTGVENVLAEGENGEVVYYNLQGIRVDNPNAAGVYVRVQGKDVKKVVIK